MFVQHDLKEDIESYQLDDGTVYFDKVDGTSRMIAEGVTVLLDTQFAVHFSWNNLLVLTDPNSQITSFWDKGKEVKRLEFFSLGVSNGNLFVTYRKDGSKYLEVLNANFESVFKQVFKVGGHNYFNSNLFVCSEYLKANKINVFTSDHTLKSIEIENNYWLTSDEDKVKGQVFQVIGQWRDELLVFIGKFRILSVDINSGEENWRIEDFLEPISGQTAVTFTKSKRLPVKWDLDERDDKAYLLVQNNFFELDLEKRKSRLVRDYNESSDLEWDFKKSRLYDDLITFAAANTLGAFPNVVGVIDKNTKEILWTTKCEPGIYFEEAPQIKDDKLYILDSSKTLHIFEKETTPTTI